MGLLITRPEHDLTTRYLSHWSNKIIEVAVKKGVDVIDLKGRKANKKELTGRLQKLNPSLVILNGHGNQSSVTGHDNETLVKAGSNEKILSSRITYAVSCSSAKRLGTRCAKREDTTYIGYDDDFIFAIDKKRISHPLQDKRAKPFMDASNQVSISLLKGHKATDASKRSKKTFMKKYMKLLSSNSSPDDLQDARLLWWNRIHQKCLGDQNAVVNF